MTIAGLAYTEPLCRLVNALGRQGYEVELTRRPGVPNTNERNEWHLEELEHALIEILIMQGYPEAVLHRMVRVDGCSTRPGRSRPASSSSSGSVAQTLSGDEEKLAGRQRGRTSQGCTEDRVCPTTGTGTSKSTEAGHEISSTRT